MSSELMVTVLPATLAASITLGACMLMPPEALRAPDTVVLLSFVNVNEPLPAVTDDMEIARPDCVIVVLEVLDPPPLLADTASVAVLTFILPLFVLRDKPLPS